MLNWIARILLTSTAIAPVGATFAWVAWNNGSTTLSVVIFSISVALLLICLGMLSYARRRLEKMPFVGTKIEAADRENMGFLLLYLLPLFTADFQNLNWATWVPAILMFAVITATGYNYHFNPLIGLLGWHFYKVESKEGVTYVLITKRQLRSAAGSLTVGQLTEYILIDLGRVEE